MKRLLLFLVLCVSFSVSAQNEALNDKYGFRDATFERPVSSFKGLKLIKTDGHQKLYTRSTDKLLIGEYPLSRITYVFLDGLLMEVRINAIGNENTSGIIQAMMAAYGVPQVEGDKYTWSSTRVFMKGDISTNGTTLFLRMVSMPLFHKQTELVKQEVEQDARRNQKAVKKAASDL